MHMVLYIVYIYHLSCFFYILLTWDIYLIKIFGQMKIKCVRTIHKSQSKRAKASFTHRYLYIIYICILPMQYGWVRRLGVGGG